MLQTNAKYLQGPFFKSLTMFIIHVRLCLSTVYGPELNYWYSSFKKLKQGVHITNTRRDNWWCLGLYSGNFIQYLQTRFFFPCCRLRYKSKLNVMYCLKRFLDFAEKSLVSGNTGMWYEEKRKRQKTWKITCLFFPPCMYVCYMLRGRRIIKQRATSRWT